MLPGQTRKHLLKMRANPEMLAFLTGFDTIDGKWSHEKARKAFGNKNCPASTKANPRPSPSSTPAPKQKPKTRTHSAAMPSDLSSNCKAQSRSQKAPKASSVSTKGQRLSPSRTFTIASQGRVSNMRDFRRPFRSYYNSGEGDCLFESFRQSLQLSDSVLEMRSNMVSRLLHVSEDDLRVAQINEHLMREIDARNEAYMGWGALGNDGLNAHTARVTLDSPHFALLWERYTEDMMYGAAYAGGAEATALADMFGVNVTIWTYNERSDTATHLTTHLQSQPSTRTVHLLSIGNNHYEATNLPPAAYPILVIPSSQSQIQTRGGVQQLPPPNLPPHLDQPAVINKDSQAAQSTQTSQPMPQQTSLPILSSPEQFQQPPAKRSRIRVSPSQVHGSILLLYSVCQSLNLIFHSHPFNLILHPLMKPTETHLHRYTCLHHLKNLIGPSYFMTPTFYSPRFILEEILRQKAFNRQNLSPNGRANKIAPPPHLLHTTATSVALPREIPLFSHTNPENEWPQCLS